MTGVAVIGTGPEVVETVGPTAEVLTLTVESSRSAVVRPVGRVPCHPGDDSRARVRCNFLRIGDGGTMDRRLGSEDRGRSDDRTVSESRIH